MRKIVFFITSFVIFGITANAQRFQIKKEIEQISSNQFVKQILFSQKKPTIDTRNRVGKYVKSFDILELDSSVLSKIVRAKTPALQIDVPFKGNLLTLKLVKSDVIGEQTVFFSSSESEKKSIPYNRGAYYYGIIQNQPNTIVAISFFNENVIGVISSEKGNYVLGKSNRLNQRSTEYIVYNDKDLLISNDFECGTIDIPTNIPVLPQGNPKIEERCDRNPAVGVYIETDYQIYLNQGSNETNVLNFVTGLFNITTTLYRNESIDTVISEINVWTDPDPYLAVLNTREAIHLFGDRMFRGFNGDLAHLFSARALGGGIAYLNTLCEEDRFKTAVSGGLTNSTNPFPTYSWNAYVVTHEMGHNLGSEHTQACVWNANNTAIDGCAATEGNCVLPPIPSGGGTIMSYCHRTNVGINFNLGFGPQPGDLIRRKVSSAYCLTGCSCASNLVISNNVLEGNTDNRAASQSIAATNTIFNNGTAVYHAGEQVLLLPGFRAKRGAEFHTFIGGCSTSSREETQPMAYNTIDESQANGANLIEKSIDEKFKVFPNPFTDIVTFEYQVTQNNSPVTLKIYNILGKEVETLVSKEQETKGNYKLQFDGTHLPEGIYLYRLEIGETVKTGKIILKK